ncbi:MAG: hypothetical protein RL885_14355 [Planctomycetota bacterium]
MTGRLVLGSLLVCLTGCLLPKTRAPIVVQQRSASWPAPGVQRVLVRPFVYSGPDSETARRGVEKLLLGLEQTGRFQLIRSDHIVAAPAGNTFPPRTPAGVAPHLILTGDVLVSRPYPPQSFGLAFRFEDVMKGEIVFEASGVFDASNAETRDDLEAWTDDHVGNDSEGSALNESLLSVDRFQQYVTSRWMRELIATPVAR